MRMFWLPEHTKERYNFPGIVVTMRLSWMRHAHQHIVLRFADALKVSDTSVTNATTASYVRIAACAAALLPQQLKAVETCVVRIESYPPFNKEAVELVNQPVGKCLVSVYKQLRTSYKNA